MGVIDNRNDFLGKNIEEILPLVKNLDIFVGYFYFSGFRELYKELKDKRIRILVGLEISKEILKHIKNIETLANLPEDPESVLNPNRSKTFIRQKYIDTFAKVFNDSDLFDKEEEIIAFKLFMDKLKDGSMEIKKTIKSEHGKFYLFYDDKKEGEEFLRISIMGSSNFTYNGLRGQGELNKRSNDTEDFESYRNVFEDQWSDENSVPISTLETYPDFEKDIKQKIWLFSLPEPYKLYLKVLKEYYAAKDDFSIIPVSKITKGEYMDLKYQTDAIKLGIDRIERYNGVIIADVVGLGKSIIAAAIAHNQKLKTVVIAPPHLVDSWNDYCEQFDITARVYSSGKIDEVISRYGNSEEKRLFILDEAHKYRNEETDDYANLHKLCQNNKVIVLSATPFNNDPKDIFALVKLFDVPGRSKLKTVENLSMQFRELIKRYKQIRKDLKKDSSSEMEFHKRTEEIAQELRRIIEPLVIRRSRLDLDQIDEYRQDLEKQGIRFPLVEPPELLSYELKELSSLYVDTLERIHSINKDPEENYFQGVRYQPAKYLSPGKKQDFYKELEKEGYKDDDVDSIEQAQVNVAKFMRTLLVRRFESSIFAFGRTLDAMIESHRLIKKWYENLDLVPIYKKGLLPDVDEFNDLFSEEIDEELKSIQLNEELSRYQKRGLILIPKKYLTPDFIVKLNADIRLLERLREQWGKNLPDPKFDYFKSNLEEFIKKDPQRKIVIFSEFSDTVDYITDRLQKETKLKVFKYSAKEGNRQNREIIRKNFDAGIDSSKQLNDYDILIATDAISEGFNLHRAGAIYNYDIPYNPTRVIQRIGRINRVNKKVFDKLFIFNFFPTPTGEQETNTKKISQLKMNLIHSLLGEDTKILTNEEELRNYFVKQYEDEQKKAERTTWEAVHRNEWNRVKDEQSLLDEISDIPHRTRISRKNQSKKGVIVFGKRGASIIFGLSSEGELVFINDEVALGLFKANKEEKANEITPQFTDLYYEVKKMLFKDNTAVSVAGKRRQEVLIKIKYIRGKVSKSKAYCDDIITIIKDFDGLPDGILKDLNKVDIKNPEAAYEDLKRLVPLSYKNSIFENAQSMQDDQELIVLSEELL